MSIVTALALTMREFDCAVGHCYVVLSWCCCNLTHTPTMHVFRLYGIELVCAIIYKARW